MKKILSKIIVTTVPCVIIASALVITEYRPLNKNTELISISSQQTLSEISKRMFDREETEI